MQTSRFEVRLTPEQKIQLKTVAAAERLTMSGYVLALVRSAVSRQPLLSREEIDALHLSREQLRGLREPRERLEGHRLEQDPAQRPEPSPLHHPDLSIVESWWVRGS